MSYHPANPSQIEALRLLQQRTKEQKASLENSRALLVSLLNSSAPQDASMSTHGEAHGHQLALLQSTVDSLQKKRQDLVSRLDRCISTAKYLQNLAQSPRQPNQDYPVAVSCLEISKHRLSILLEFIRPIIHSIPGLDQESLIFYQIAWVLLAVHISLYSHPSVHILPIPTGLLLSSDLKSPTLFSPEYSKPVDTRSISLLCSYMTRLLTLLGALPIQEINSRGPLHLFDLLMRTLELITQDG